MQDLEKGRKIVEKFIENFFIKDLMEQSKMESLGYKEAEEEKKSSEPNPKYNENSEEQQKMTESFYQKEGLDFLYFQRQGTAYNNPAAFGMGTVTRS